MTAFRTGPPTANTHHQLPIDFIKGKKQAAIKHVINKYNDNILPPLFLKEAIMIVENAIK